MSFFRRLLGRETIEELEAEADKAAADGQFGTAKLQLERALEKVDPEDDDNRTRLRERVESMRDRIAESRLATAERFLSDGNEDAALLEANGAAEVAASSDVAERARQTAMRIRMRAAMHRDEAPPVLTREQEIAAITASWTENQTEEYDAYGDDVIDASIALAEGHFVRARDLFERILDTAEEPRWLHRDVARARWAAGDLEGADAAFTRFLDAGLGEEDEPSVFVAHLDRARLFEELSRPEDALAEIERALDHAGDSPRAFAHVAHYLRERDHVEEARDVLNAALTLPGSESDPAVHVELALCEASLGEYENALGRLDRLAQAVHQQGRGDTRDIDSERARLLERLGRGAHALEIHKRLAASGADAFAFEHALRAAKLAHTLGDREESDRQLARASVLAELDARRKELLAETRATLDAG